MFGLQATCDIKVRNGRALSIYLPIDLVQGCRCRAIAVLRIAMGGHGASAAPPINKIERTWLVNYYTSPRLSGALFDREINPDPFGNGPAGGISSSPSRLMRFLARTLCPLGRHIRLIRVAIKQEKKPKEAVDGELSRRIGRSLPIHIHYDGGSSIRICFVVATRRLLLTLQMFETFVCNSCFFSVYFSGRHAKKAYRDEIRPEVSAKSRCV